MTAKADGNGSKSISSKRSNEFGTPTAVKTVLIKNLPPKTN